MFKHPPPGLARSAPSSGPARVMKLLYPERSLQSCGMAGCGVDIALGCAEGVTRCAEGGMMIAYWGRYVEAPTSRCLNMGGDIRRAISKGVPDRILPISMLRRHHLVMFKGVHVKSGSEIWNVATERVRNLMYIFS